jgi:membrane protease subunit (stomatin/prohibitin family)
MKNCVIIFNEERTEFVDNGGIVTVTQTEDGEHIATFNISPVMAESLKQNLLADEGAKELPL